MNGLRGARASSDGVRIWPAVWLTFAVILGRCAAMAPPPSDTRGFRARAERRQATEVAVSVLGAGESEAEFGVPLASKGIQPIWLEVKNEGPEEFLLMLLCIDPEYFSPSKVAWRVRGDTPYAQLLHRFDRAHIPVVIPPRSRRAGFDYANPDPGAKVATVRLIGERDTRNLQFVLPVPDFEADFDRVDLRTFFRVEEVRDVDLDGLRAFLQSLPCCVLDGDRATPGDPLTLVVVGDGLHVLATFVRQGWDLTETIRSDTVWSTIGPSLFGSRHRTSPVSPLCVFGRRQDVALQGHGRQSTYATTCGCGWRR